MDDATVETTTIIPWTIKAISKAARDVATEAARREGLTVGQWLEKAITGYLDAGSPTVATPDRVNQSHPDPAIADLAALLTAVGTLPEHIPLPGEVRTLINDRARQARGQPKPKQAIEEKLRALQDNT